MGYRKLKKRCRIRELLHCAKFLRPLPVSLHLKARNLRALQVQDAIADFHINRKVVKWIYTLKKTMPISMCVSVSYKITMAIYK